MWSSTCPWAHYTQLDCSSMGRACPILFTAVSQHPQQCLEYGRHFVEWKIEMNPKRLLTVLISCGSCNKLLSYNNRNLFSHNSGGRKFKIKVSVELCSLWDSEYKPSLPLTRLWWWLSVLGFLLFPAESLPFPPPSSHGILPMRFWSNFPLSYKNPNHLKLRHTLIQYNFILTWLHLQSPYIQIRSESQALGVKSLTCVWGGTWFNP